MNKKAKYALMVIMMLFILAYFAINYYTQGMYRIDFEGYTKCYAGDELPIKVNIYKGNMYSSSRDKRVKKNFKAYLINSDGKKVKGFNYSGKTFDDRDTNAIAKLPEDIEPGDYKLAVKTSSIFIRKIDYANIKIEKASTRNMVISLDKGIYKPGDTVRYRVMILSRKNQTPIESDDVTVNIFDGNGNKVYSVEGTSTD